MVRPRAIALVRLCALLGVAGLSAGCATPGLEAARQNYYLGRTAQADKILEKAKPPEKDQVLFLMERGTIRQGAGHYEESAKDFNEAAARLEALQTYSVSKGAASWVVNDGVQNFRGAPFERTMVHVMAAKDYLAQGAWDDAGVEARRIIRSLEPDFRGKYPEDAYSRYMAGFCLEMIDDDSNAGVQYRRASELLGGLAVDDQTGRLYPRPPPGPDGQPGPPPAAVTERWPRELVVFVMSGRAPRADTQWRENWQPEPAAYAEIYAGDQLLGRSYSLADIAELTFLTEKLRAVQQTAKTVGRVILKEAIAQSVEHNTKNAFWGELVRFILIGLLEQPDIRRWETLPRWMQVARVQAPSDLTGIKVVFKNSFGHTLRTIEVSEPLSRRRNTYVTFCRDIVPR
ncbi:MAG: hypothetical protein KKC51_00085 [Verrucomicrobia bacterium]|nr:hypothetical protein [Verrucomicrobiota bacterium]